MAFAYTVEGMESIGELKHVFGTFTNGGGDSGGTIATGLNQIKFGSTTDLGAAVHDGVDTIDSTSSGGNLIIITDAGVDGLWEVYGC